MSPRTKTTPTICLTMIVKNEARVIRRCLASVRPLVTSYSIVDTGSTDGTQDIVRKTLKGLPGKVHERPWKDFGFNRTEALRLAHGRAQYNLVIDADDTLIWPKGFTLPALDRDRYDLEVEDRGLTYPRPHLFRNDLPFHYVGVLHEYLALDQPHSFGRLEGLRYRRLNGKRQSRDPETFRRDAATLEAALAHDPENTRYVFYLAQSYRDSGNYAEAAKVYAKRATMGGWAEEVWYSLFEYAHMMEWLQRHDRVVEAYKAAYDARPTRAEPLCDLARYFRESGNWEAAYPVAKKASEILKPADILFIEEAVYAWRALDELAIAAYYVGRFEEALVANERLLASSVLPETERARVEENIAFCRAKVSEVEALEDAEDIAAVDDWEKRKARGEKTIPAAEVWRKLGI